MRGRSEVKRVRGTGTVLEVLPVEPRLLLLQLELFLRDRVRQHLLTSGRHFPQLLLLNHHAHAAGTGARAPPDGGAFTVPLPVSDFNIKAPLTV